jgi:hypothetical protein
MKKVIGWFGVWVAVLALLGETKTGFTAEAQRAQREEKPQVVSNYGKLPLSFEANQGQTDKAVKFFSRGSGYGLYLTPTEMVLTLRKPSNDNDAPVGANGSSPLQTNALPPPPAGEGRGEGNPDEVESATVRMKLVGANPSPKMAGEAALPGKINYLIGNNPAKWRTNIPTFGKVRYEAVYPGIDLVYYGNQQQMEYDFIVAPGADPNQILVDVRATGRSPLQIADNGDLVLATDGGDVRMKKPVIYQDIAGIRVPVSGGYRLQPPPSQAPRRHSGAGRNPEGVEAGGDGFRIEAFRNDGQVGIADPLQARPSALPPLPRGEGWGEGKHAAPHVSFQIAAYDRTRPLIIDPILVYSTYLGGALGFDYGQGIAVDSTGAAYITGRTGSPDFPTASQGAHAGFFDAFVTKINPSGSALVYSTYLGGGGSDFGWGIAVDATGAAYVTGQTTSTNFPTFPTASPLQGAFAGGSDAFVTKINPAGSALVYSTYLGGVSTDDGRSIAVDATGAAYVTGQTYSGNFPTLSPIQPDQLGLDVFVTKIDPAGSAFVYSTHLGGAGDEYGRGIAVDATGAAYVTGLTSSGDFPTASPLQGAHAGSFDVFVTKINPAGSARVYSTYLGGAGIDDGLGIAVDTTGAAYVTGLTNSTNFPTTSPLQGAFAGGYDAFVTKIHPSGSARIYSTYLGGIGDDGGLSIAVDASGAAYVTGYTNFTDFPTASPIQGVLAGDYDAFVTKIHPAGSPLVYSTYLGGAGYDRGTGIAVDATGAATVTGQTNSIVFPMASPIQGGLAGGYDAFVTKILNDADGDGVLDLQDNCPFVANTDQSDLDRDQVGDACDPWSDIDGDNLPDGSDNCLMDYNPTQADGDGDGIGDVCASILFCPGVLISSNTPGVGFSPL